MAEAVTDPHQGEATRFQGDLSAPDPIPEAGIEAAVSLMRDGRLFRYGEDRNSKPEAAILEEEFAAYVGRKYCLGVNSCGCSLFIALRAAGVKPGDDVLMNAFTLAPVPGAIAHAGAKAVLVDIDERLVVDVDDLDRKAAASGARFFMLSYMRGHIPDMDAVMAVCRRHNLVLIEDCAHTMGADWNGRMTGTFGAAACFSTQTFKHINSGEGGLIVADDEDVAARAVLLSGSYMLYRQHRARPSDEVFERHRYDMPNCSMRMSSLVAAILRSQLPILEERNGEWRRIYNDLAPRIDSIAHLRMPVRPAQEGFVPSSLQFFVDDLSDGQIQRFLSDADGRGVHVKWFGNPEPIGFTSRHEHWRYLQGHNRSDVPNADRILHRLCDMRLPPWLSGEDCATIARVLAEAMAEVVSGRRAKPPSKRNYSCQTGGKRS
jgi:dTDP-4-amino-4,6-dideoxygalactose transaminase